MVQQNIHGGDIYRNQVSLDFSVNINPFGMPQRVREALEAAVAWCERYPDIRSEALRDAIAGAKGIAPADIVCGNGASELFPAILRAVHAKKVLLPVPSFYGYEYAAKSVGAEICCHELLETDGYAVTERFLTAIGEGVNAVFLAVPNNPVGTVVERKTRFVVLCKMDGCTAQAALEGFTRQMKKLPAFLRESLTYDNGSEMACHAELSKRLKLDIWFCDPHAPWQRGSNENTNGLLRQFLPKGADLSQVSQTQLNDIARLMNGRPRKTLNWKTPEEAMAKEMAEYAKRVALDS